jgi:hypothetical protein
MADNVMVVRPVSMAVRLLDLSSEGVLLACPDAVRLGATARVVARLAGRSLDTELEIRHVSSQWDQRSGGYRVGGRFLSPGSQSVLAIKELLNGSSP